MTFQLQEMRVSLQRKLDQHREHLCKERDKLTRALATSEDITNTYDLVYQRIDMREQQLCEKVILIPGKLPLIFLSQC